MMSPDIPVKTLIAYEKIRKSFLQKSRKDVKGGHYLVTWNSVQVAWMV
jgi:hypothetical protein